MAGYIRQDTTNNIADGNVINASDFDNEYNAIEAAFHATTGHTHDGTSAEGAPITKVGPAQDLIVGIAAITPKTDNTLDLGSSLLEFKDLYIDGTANIDSLVADTADINAGTIDGTIIGGSVAAAGTFTTATATTGNITTVNATTVDTTNIEVTTLKAKDGTSAGSIADTTGVVTLASSVLTTTDINGGTIDGVTIGGASAGAGTFTTATATTGNITTVNATTVDTTNLEVTSLKAKDGTASATIADSTGVMTIASAVLTTADINGGTMDNVTIGGSTPAAGNFTNLDATGTLAVDGNVTLGDASTDTVQVNGTMGVGGTPSTAAGLRVLNSALLGVAQYGIVGAPVGTSSGTTALIALQTQPETSAASYTVTDVIGVRAFNATKGAGSTITNQHGVYIADQTQGTNNYGITSLVSSGSNKWNIYASGTAFNFMAGGLGIGSGQTTSSSYGVTGNLIVNGTNAPIISSTSASGTPTQLIAMNGGNQNADRGVAFDLYSPGTGLGVSGSRATGRIISAGSFAGTQGGYLRFDTENTSGTLTERLRIDSSGNLGLGVTPSAWNASGAKVLQMGALGAFVFGDNSSINSGSNAAYIGGWQYVATGFSTRYEQQAGQHRFFTAPSGTAGNAITFTERASIGLTEMVVNDPGNDYDFRVESDTNTHALFVQGSDGFVGIGTSSPEERLNIAGASGTSVISLERTNTGLGGGKGAVGWKSLNGYFTTAITEITDVGSDDGGGLVFRAMSGSTTTNAYVVTERLRITSSGNVGIGTTTPTQKLDVAGTANATTLTEAGVAVVVQTDIGTAPNEIPLNQYLGSLAYVDTAMVPAPATATSAGQQGQLAQDGSYLYVCTALNTWKRVAISTF